MPLAGVSYQLQGARWAALVVPCAKNSRRFLAMRLAGVSYQLQGALGELMTSKCCQCGTMGAVAKCGHTGCKRAFHLHCSEKCKHDWGGSGVIHPLLLAWSSLVGSRLCAWQCT